MLMYAVYLKAIENMIPDHDVRMAYLSRPLSNSGALVVMTHGAYVAEKGPARGTSDNNDIYELVESFRQSADPKLPEIKGHDDIGQQLDDFFQIPILFGSIIDPTERMSFQCAVLWASRDWKDTPRSIAGFQARHDFLQCGERGINLQVRRRHREVSLWFRRGQNRRSLIDWRIIKALADVVKNHKPSIVFIDEIDSLTRQRQSSESSFDRRSKNSLLEMFEVVSHEPSIRSEISILVCIMLSQSKIGGLMLRFPASSAL